MAKKFGYETKGASSWNIGKFFACRHVCPDAGVLNSISVYLFNDSGSTQKIQLGIYNDVSGTIGKRLISTISISIPAAFDNWRTIILPAFLNLGSVYWLTIQLENSAAIVYVYYDAGDEDQQAYKEAWDFGTWPDDPVGLTYSANKISIYATYTPVPYSPYTWGIISKNQIDPERVEAAIARIIDEHNDDEQAHIGEGRSLDQHKLSAVIDHVVASIIADKIGQDEIIPKHLKTFCDLNFDIGLIDDFAGWSNFVSGTGSTVKKFRLSQVKTGSTIASEASNYLDLAAGPAISHIMRFDIKTYLDEAFDNGDKAYINIFPDNVEPGTGDNGSKCFGFIIEGVVVDYELSYKIYGFVRRLTVINTKLLAEGLDPTNSVILTVEHDGASLFNFYIDNVYIGCLVRASMGPWGHNEKIVHSIKNEIAHNASNSLYWINYKIWVT